jgi:hypothetical protein
MRVFGLLLVTCVGAATPEFVVDDVCHGLGRIDTQPRFGLYRDAHAEAGSATIYYEDDIGGGFARQVCRCRPGWES